MSMRAMKHWLYLIVLFFNPLKAQNTFVIEARLGEKPLQCGSWYHHSKTDSLQINKCAVYLSHIQFFSHGEAVLTTEKPVLIDLCRGKFSWENIPDQTDSLSFQIGIDSSIQTAGALGGDLDPIYGMYWTWQSGYIHVKFEARTSVIPVDSAQIIYHLGGYSAPFNTIRRCGFSLGKANRLVLDLAQFMHLAWTGDRSSVMSPSNRANALSTAFQSSFQVWP